VRAVVCRALGEPDALPDVLEIAELPRPVPGPGEVVVDVSHIGLNFHETLLVAGRHVVRSARIDDGLGFQLVPWTAAFETWDGQPDPDIKIGTIHRAKGLDFAAVYLADLGTTPPPGTDPGRELAEDTAWERDRAQREYVARTRPRDRLWIGRIRPPTSPTIDI
jgi:hypothetical protein